MERNVLAFEPELALFVADDNALIFYEKIAKFAQKHFFTEGSLSQLFFECNQYNALEVAQLLQKMDFKYVELRKDMSGNDRMMRAQKG